MDNNPVMMGARVSTIECECPAGWKRQFEIGGPPTAPEIDSTGGSLALLGSPWT